MIQYIKRPANKIHAFIPCNFKIYKENTYIIIGLEKHTKYQAEKSTEIKEKQHDKKWHLANVG